MLAQGGNKTYGTFTAVSDSVGRTRSWLIRKQTGKGFPQVPDGLGFGLVLVHGRPEEGGLCEAEGVGQGLRLAARHKHSGFCMVTPCPSLPLPPALKSLVRRGEITPETGQKWAFTTSSSYVPHNCAPLTREEGLSRIFLSRNTPMFYFLSTDLNRMM